MKLNKDHVLNFVTGFALAGFLFSLGITLHNAFGIRTIKPTNNQEYANTSVMITKLDGRSGGTGVIISSANAQSKILTNAHVCGLLKNGGIVRSERMKGIVKSFQISNNHDLCLVTTNNNFKVNTVLAKEEPDVYDDAIISGHPHLLPNIVTYGHFSQKELITIMMSMRPCTIEDITNDKTAIYCQLLGGIPSIRSFEAQIVSATIMPGSSGSAVFNSKGELSGLVFAGSGDFGYAMIVPYEYINNFFESELQSLPVNFPNKELPLVDESETMNWKNVCSSKVPPKIKTVCELVSKTLLLTN
jgi:S1-C subfamily serine protease